MNSARAVLFVATLGLVATAAEATTIYDFSGTDFDLAFLPSTTTANATSSDFQFDTTLGTGCGGGSCGSYGSFTGEFSVAANAGYALDVVGFSFDEKNLTAAGPTRFDVYTSADGFASPILSSLLAPNATTFTHHAVTLALSGLTDPLVVRIVASGHDNSTGGGLWVFDQVSLLATAVPLAAPVPEPTSMALLGTGLIGAIGNRQRRRRR